MTESKEYYLASVEHGLVLSYKANGQPSGVSLQFKGDQDKEQKWTIESGDQPNRIALKCSATGRYLNTQEGKNWGKVFLGEKQWWKYDRDNVSPPSAIRLSPVQFPNVFLNHYNGETTARGSNGVKVHMWQWLQPREHWFTWYFVSADEKFGPQAAVGAADEAKIKELEAKSKDLEPREAALAEREQSTTSKQRDLEARETTLAEREQSMTSKQRDSEAANEAKMEELETKSKDLKARETTLAERERSMTSKQRDFEAASEAKTKELEAKSEDLKAKEATLAEREQSMTSKQRDLEAQATDNKTKVKELQAERDATAEREQEAQARQKELLDALKAREQVFSDKQKGAAREQETNSRNSQKRERELDEREKVLARREAEQASMNKQKGAAEEQETNFRNFQKRERELDEREKALAKREAKQAREQAPSNQQRGAAGEQETNVRNLQKRECELNEREEVLAKREVEQAASKGSVQSRGASAAGQGGDGNAATSEAILKQIQDRLAGIEDKLSQPQQPSPTSHAAANDTKPSGPPSVKVAASQRPTTKSLPIHPPKSNTQNCGHLTHAPPRKLEKKIVGYVYETKAANGGVRCDIVRHRDRTS